MRRERPRTRHRRHLARLRAVLAGGLALGIGATGTLATWSDTEHGSATFTAGTFGVIGSTDGTTFDEHNTSTTSAALGFQIPPTAMAPGTTTYALFSVRTRPGSLAGSVQLAADPGNSAGLGAHLVYGVRTISSTTCDATTFEDGTIVVATGSPLTTGSSTPLPLDADGASQLNYCFAVTLPDTAPNEAQGEVLTARWEFPASST